VDQEGRAGGQDQELRLHPNEGFKAVIASAAKQSIALKKTGLLRRFAPRNDEMHSRF
jgi:hypothetical protein